MLFSSPSGRIFSVFAHASGRERLFYHSMFSRIGKFAHKKTAWAFISHAAKNPDYPTTPGTS
jgi:hypothetical protein